MALPPKMLKELRSVDGVRLWVDAPLAPFTSIRTGGKADVLITAADIPAVAATLRLLHDYAVPWACLGAGTDLLVADEGYRGAVVKLDDTFHYVEGLPDGTEWAAGKAVVTVGAGTLLARFAAVAADAGLAGLEFACGIPGSVGGAVATNAGAYGRSMSDVVAEVQLVGATGVSWVSAADLEWEYRSCRLPEQTLVVAARFELAPGEPATILERHREILHRRRVAQPQGVRTFGCAFRNPSGGGAGRLIEAAGLKGVQRGGAEISTVHANFLVNMGDATTADVLALMSLIREEVKRRSAVTLEPEVRLLGGGFPWESCGVEPQEPPAGDG